MKVFNGESAETVERRIERRRKKKGEREVERKAAIREWRVEMGVNVPTKENWGKI